MRLFGLCVSVLLGFSGISSAQVVINEVDADQVGTDAAEFVELFDGGAGNTDLTGLVLVLFNGSDDASYRAFDLDGQSTDADGYFVLCGIAANVPNCDLDVTPNTNLIQNGADAVALLIGDAADFPNDTPVTTANLIDALVYDTNDPDDVGLLALLNAGQPQVNEGGAGVQIKRLEPALPQRLRGRSQHRHLRPAPSDSGRGKHMPHGPSIRFVRRPSHAHSRNSGKRLQ